MRATFDPSRNLDLYFRKGRNGILTFNFFNIDGSEHDLTGQTFEFIGSFDVTITVFSNTITLDFSENESIKRDRSFWELVNTLTVKTWLCGTAFFTSDLSADVISSEDITINLGDQVVNVYLNNAGSSLLLDWDMDTNLFPENSKRGQDYYGVITTSSTLEDRSGNLLPSGTIAKALINNASTSDPNDWAFTYTII